MGLDIDVVKKSNYCEHCGRYEVKKIYQCGSGFFSEDAPPVSEIKESDGKTSLIYRGASHVFEGIIENCERYKGEDAIQRLEKVKMYIDKDEYEKVTKALKEPNAEFYAWW